MVRYTKPGATDDPGFLDWVEATVVGVEEAIDTKQTYVVKIDNWFGQRWLGFSGKALGALAHANGFMCGNASGENLQRSAASN